MVRALHHIRSPLTTEVRKTIAVVLVGTRLKYTVTFYLLAYLFQTWLVYKNVVTRVVPQKSRFSHITPLKSALAPRSSQNEFQDSF